MKEAASEHSHKTPSAISLAEAIFPRVEAAAGQAVAEAEAAAASTGAVSEGAFLLHCNINEPTNTHPSGWPIRFAAELIAAGDEMAIWVEEEIDDDTRIMAVLNESPLPGVPDLTYWVAAVGHADKGPFDHFEAALTVAHNVASQNSGKTPS